MHEKIQLLISGYFIGSLTKSEEKELKDHLESCPDDQQLFDDYCLLWEESGQRIAVNPIDVELALKKTKQRLVFSKINFWQLLQRVAAVLFLAGLFSTAFIYYRYKGTWSNQIAHQVITQEVSTISGTRSKFQLSDGTTVNLNSGSKLIFPSEFSGHSRNVELIGEAFFEVAPDPQNPFIVKAKEINVKVLGTAFNLQAYPWTDEINTTLLHGKVVLEREVSGVSKKLVELKPMERAVFNAEMKAIKISAEEDIEKYIAWKDGKLVFFDDPLEDVAKKLGNWYNVIVTIKDSSKNHYRFTATFTDEPIEQVLDLLSKSSPIKYQIKKATRLTDNTYSKRVIVFN